MKSLNGSELASFIKAQQAQQVRNLRQAHGVIPRLAVIQTTKNPVIDLYVRLKKAYGEDILVEVEAHNVVQATVPALLAKLNEDPLIHGIILQLPLEDTAETQKLCNLIAKNKDVDALGDDTMFDAAAPTAIMWLLAGYNINLPGKNIVVVGRGKLVGAPLLLMFEKSGLSANAVDERTADLREVIKAADVVITATGKDGLITSDLLKQEAVVIDAGTSSEKGKIVGDLAADVYQRQDLTITPQKGGVGPLTICALFSNVIRAARESAGRAA
jgi:methylenetetrahydrofolate dehydrogenase (NADP+)/methenyltetrahydrofolate cyclohydrolase